MARTCTICNHQKRAEIEAAIITGTSLRNIAKQFSVGYSSVARYASEHITETIAHSQAAKEEVLALSAANELKWANQQMHAIYEAATSGEKPDLKLALQTAAHVTKWAEVWGRLQGEINDGTHIDISIHPEWIVIQQTIMQALHPHLEARIAVSEALAKLESLQSAT